MKFVIDYISGLYVQHMGSLKTGENHRKFMLSEACDGVSCFQISVQSVRRSLERLDLVGWTRLGKKLHLERTVDVFQ